MKLTREQLKKELMEDFRSMTQRREVELAVSDAFDDIRKCFGGENPYPKGSYLAQVFDEALKDAAEAEYKEERYRDYMERTGPQAYGDD